MGLWIQNGGARWLAPIMAAIAEVESGGSTVVINNNSRTKDYSVGLWQINYYGNLRPGRTQQFGSPEALQKDPNKQAKAAIALAAGGKGLSSNWRNTYQSKSYYSILAKNKGVKPQKPPTGLTGGDIIPNVPSPGDIAGGIANALIPDWINKHNTVRFGQGFMGFAIVVLGIVVLAREGAKSAPAQAVTETATAATGAGRAARGAAYTAGRAARGNATRPVYKPARQARTRMVTVPGVMGKNGGPRQSSGRMLRADESIPF